MVLNWRSSMPRPLSPSAAFFRSEDACLAPATAALKVIGSISASLIEEAGNFNPLFPHIPRKKASKIDYFCPGCRFGESQFHSIKTWFERVFAFFTSEQVSVLIGQGKPTA